MVSSVKAASLAIGRVGHLTELQSDWNAQIPFRIVSPRIMSIYSPDPFSSWRVGSGHETICSLLAPLYLPFLFWLCHFYNIQQVYIRTRLLTIKSLKFVVQYSLSSSMTFSIDRETALRLASESIHLTCPWVPYKFQNLIRLSSYASRLCVKVNERM